MNLIKSFATRYVELAREQLQRYWNGKNPNMRKEISKCIWHDPNPTSYGKQSKWAKICGKKKFPQAPQVMAMGVDDLSPMTEISVSDSLFNLRDPQHIFTSYHGICKKGKIFKIILNQY